MFGGGSVWDTGGKSRHEWSSGSSILQTIIFSYILAGIPAAAIDAAPDQETERIMSFRKTSLSNKSKSLAAWAAGLATVATSMAASAGSPLPWQMGFQPAATTVMERMNDFHNMLLMIIFVIGAFVTALMVYVMVRFNAKSNLEPSKRTHNTMLEVVWTAIPIMILVIIAIPSFKLLYFQDRAPNAEMTIKVTGNQFYWNYEYPDDGFDFDATMVGDDELTEGQLRLLSTDTEVVVPVDTEIRVLVTAADVIHAWAVPAFGVKIDAVPGRLNETWFKAIKKGTFYGQCSELCGTNHGFMPIQVKVVSKADYASWKAKAKVEYAADDAPAEKLAKVAAISKKSN